MGRQFHIWPEAPIFTGELMTLQATIEDGQGQQQVLWYRMPTHYREAITDQCDAFVMAVLFWAMKRASTLTVHGPVSPSLLQNLTEYQAAWVCWRPQHYRLVEIKADLEREPAPAPQEQAIVTFSGGVDSCFTVLRHRQHLCGRWQRPLSTALMVQGFDIPLSETAVFEQAMANAQAMLAGLDIDLKWLATNFRDLPQPWEDAHATGIISCLTWFQPQYRIGLIASSHTYEGFYLPYGSNPVSDPLLSSAAFQVIHDGASFDRPQKVKQLATWPGGLQHLRVCWEGAHKDRNCGRCEKCIRTILNFRVVGLGLPPCFERDITDEELRQLRGLNPLRLNYYQTILNHAMAAGITDSWVKVLQEVMQRNRHELKVKAWKERLKQTLPVGFRQQIQTLRARLPKA